MSCAVGPEMARAHHVTGAWLTEILHSPFWVVVVVVVVVVDDVDVGEEGGGRWVGGEDLGQ